MKRQRVSKVAVLLWAQREMERQMADPWRGYCPGCDRQKLNSECRQAERDECCMHVCRACGEIIDESPPF